MRDWLLEPILDQLNRIEQLISMHIRLSVRQGRKELANLQDILAAVTAQATVTDSVVALLEQLKALVDAGAPTAEIQAALDGILANTAELEAAVVANTPAAPPTP